MLLSDYWQPAVLQLLPFSSNDASNTQSPSSARLRSLPTPDPSRGFPVLAVTRSGKEGVASNGFSPGGRGYGFGVGPNRAAPARAFSERLTRAQAQVDTGFLVSQPRARSEYHTHRSADGTAGSANYRSNGAGSQPRDLNTCSLTDMNERVIGRMSLGTDSASPDSGSIRHSPFSSVSPELRGSNRGGSARGLPKPAFPHNALSPTNNTAAGVIGAGPSSQKGEGRHLVSKNGMWRSTTLTPGEQELKKHKDQLDIRDGENGRRYHKMNVRDLPRSTTPVNDHDPDKLNMKQVIAFLQSKGRSQTDAVELSHETKGKVKINNHDLHLPQTVKAGVLRGTVRKPPTNTTTTTVTASSSATDIGVRSSARLSAEATGGGEGGGRGVVRDGSPSSPLLTRRGEREGGEGRVRSSGGPPSARGSRDRQTARSRRSPVKENGQGRPDSHSESSPRKAQHKKPFRLHRFLTMVPTARDPALPTSPAFSSEEDCALQAWEAKTQPAVSNGRDHDWPQPLAYTSIHSRPKTYSVVPKREATAVPLVPTTSAHKERNLCVDIASQSKTQFTVQPKTELYRCQTALPQQAKGGQGSGQGSEGKVHYRLSASRPRPSSLRVEQDSADAQSKLSADFGDLHQFASSFDILGAEPINDGFPRQEKNVIRLPFVLVDSEDEELTADFKRFAKPNRGSRSAKPAGTWSRNPERKRQSPPQDRVSAVTQASWAGQERRARRKPNTQAESVSSRVSLDPTQSASSLITASQTSMATVSLTDVKSDQLQESEANSRDSRVPNVGSEVKSPDVVKADNPDDVIDGHNHAHVAGEGKNASVAGKDKSENVTPDKKAKSLINAKAQKAKKVKVKVPDEWKNKRDREDVTKQNLPDCVTLSLRKERHRTRESTYMSDMGGSDVYSDDTVAARVNSESVRPSLKSDDMISWAS